MTVLKEKKREDDRIMSPKQMIDGLMNGNLYDLLAFLTWYVKRDGTTCIECIETRSMLSKKAPNCVKCGLPTARLLKKHFNKETL